jgi:sortase A
MTQATHRSTIGEPWRPVVLSLPVIGTADRYRVVGAAVTLLGAILLGFAVQFAGLSQISHARDQALLTESFRYALANATAPVGPVGADGRLIEQGTPIAIVEISSIRLRQVVVEGTTSDVTKSALGHRRDTAFPGQAGSSVIFGRQASYGGPFGSLSSVRVGALITVSTGQGSNRYRVVNVRYTGDPLPAALASGQSRLTLVSAAGLPYLPDRVLRVDAILQTAAQDSPGRVLGFSALSDDELAMAGQPSTLPTLVFALILLIVAVVGVLFAFRFWGPWQAWVVGVPVLFALGSFTASQAANLLPNLI